jgi:hypothetical protein
MQVPGWRRDADGLWTAWLGNNLWAVCQPGVKWVPNARRGGKERRVWRCSVVAHYGYGMGSVTVRAWSGVDAVPTLREAKIAALGEAGAVVQAAQGLLAQYQKGGTR